MTAHPTTEVAHSFHMTWTKRNIYGPCHMEEWGSKAEVQPCSPLGDFKCCLLRNSWASALPPTQETITPEKASPFEMLVLSPVSSSVSDRCTPVYNAMNSQTSLVSCFGWRVLAFKLQELCAYPQLSCSS